MYVFMLKKYTYLLSPLILALIVMSCHSDIGEVNPGTEQTNQITVPLGFDEIKGDLNGFIFDDSNNPIAGAKVSIYSEETTTNDFGVFTFKNANLDPQGTFVKVEKEGYMIGSDLVYPNTNGKGTAKIMMLEVINEPSFEASEGGVVEIQGGGTITFPPSSLIRANGSIYSGNVKSTAYRLSPSDLELGNKMAGGLLGIDDKGRHQVLSTYGILAVELRGFDNQKLRIKSDKVAELSFPIETEFQNFVQDDVPSWNFNFQDGLWHQNMISTNDKENFKTTINTLGHWNFALPSAISQVCGRLIYNNELPAKNYVIQIINNDLPSRIGITDQDGFFCGKVPYGENLKFQVLHPTCLEVLKEINIGQFEEVGTIGDVILEVDEKYISGTIECSGELSSNSTIIIESNGITNVFYPNANGSFGINLDEIICNSTSSFTLFAYNNSTQLASEVKELTAEFSESLRLEICQSECEATAEFEFEKEDYCTDGEYSRVFIKVNEGSGDYTYEWADGSTEEHLNNPPTGEEVCVKVIDIETGCEYTFCEEVASYKRLSISSMKPSNPGCQKESGMIELNVKGGKEPLQYSWTGPNGFISTDAQIQDLFPGVYTLVIQDDAGCEVEESNEVFDVTIPFSTTTEDFCNQSVITVADVDGYKPYTYTWNAGIPSGNQLFVNAPGNYRVTITDANQCSRSTGVLLTYAGLLPLINTAHDCERGTVTFTDLPTGYDYYYQIIGSSDKIPVSFVQEKINIFVLESGYRFEIGSENEVSSDCFTSELVELPRFSGLSVGEVSNVSCESCADGSIEYNINTAEDCIDCSPGEVIVIRREDGMDVTDLNNEKQLEKGEYYVVVLDSSNECYIAHSLVEVE